MTPDNTNILKSSSTNGTGYQPPRIITFSAQELESHLPQVSACESFNFINNNEESFAPLQPMRPGGE